MFEVFIQNDVNTLEINNFLLTPDEESVKFDEVNFRFLSIPEICYTHNKDYH